MEYLDHDGVPRWVRRIARRFAARKVHVARRIARRANPRVTFEGIVGDVADDHVARRITDCDFIFLAADTMLARSVVNQIAHQYLIPTLQVGSKPVIEKETGEVLDVFAVVRTLGTAPGCLTCNELIDPVRLAEEALGDPVQVANQRYVDDPDVHAAQRHHPERHGGRLGRQRLHAVHGRTRPSGGASAFLRTKPVTDRVPTSPSRARPRTRVLHLRWTCVELRAAIGTVENFRHVFGQPASSPLAEMDFVGPA